MQEIYRDIPGYIGLYQASNLGNIKSLPKNNQGGHSGKILKPAFAGGGYKAVGLFKNCKAKSIKVHKLVALCFLDTSDTNLEVNHINGIKTDNRVENLELVTHSYNNKHKFRIMGYSQWNKGKLGKDSVLSKTTYQLDLSGNIIKEWSSLSDIERTLKFKSGEISKVCNGKRETAYGFKWKYNITN